MPDRVAWLEFFGAFILVIAMLHVVNHLSIPVSWFKSYPVYSGATDAMVQWWYGHNAVGFFLTTGFLGMMYYFVPKQVGRPVYSYRLSIVHFWALITLYIWAGPHHLHYTALPVGTVLFIASMWVNGITQGLMWRAINDDGTPTYSFVEALQASHPGFVVRFAGGVFFLSGMLLMAYNTWRTVRVADAAIAEREAQIA